MEKAGGPDRPAGSFAKTVLTTRLRDLEIHVAIAVDLLAERNIDSRERSMMLLILPILPVQLIAFNLIRRCRLNAVVGEGN